MDATHLYTASEAKTEYYDKRSKLTRQEYFERLAESSTLYVGKLSTDCSFELLYETFSMAAPVKNIIIGVNKKNFEPCGFAFVEFFNHDSAQKAIDLLNNYPLLAKPITLDFDWGFCDGREFGRGFLGGQANEEKTENTRGGEYGYKRGNRSFSGNNGPQNFEREKKRKYD